jgi:chaperone modulatory protein CbpM
MEHSTELNDVIMSLDELVAACGQEHSWVVALIEESIIVPDVAQQVEATAATAQKFSGYQLTLARRASRLSRDFDASVPAIGLILELLDELEQLRQFKRQWEAQSSTRIIEIDID